MTKLCRFGKEVKMRLVDNDETQEWLISEVRKDTGLYFDSSYLHKILTGKKKTPRIVESICKILDIDPDTQNESEGPGPGVPSF